MYIYVLYGVIALAIGYLLLAYFNKNILFKTIQSRYRLENYPNNNFFNSIDKTLKDEIAKNNLAQIKNKIITFYIARDELYDELKSLQKRLLKICIIFKNNPNNNLITSNRLLKFRYFDNKNFKLFDNYSCLSEEILKSNDILQDFKDLDDLTVMLRYIKEIMVENNMKVLDEITKDFIVDSKAINHENRRLIFKLFEINNECVKSLKALNKASGMQETIASFANTFNVYKMYYDKRAFKEAW